MSTFFTLLRTSSPQILQKMCSRPSGHQTLLIWFPKSTLHCLRPLLTVQLYSHCFIKWILCRILNYMWTVRHRVLKRVIILYSRKKICKFQLWSRGFRTFQISSTWLYILSKQVYTFRFKLPYKEICMFLVGNQLDAQFPVWYVYLNPVHVSSNYVLILRRTIVWIQLLV